MTVSFSIEGRDSSGMKKSAFYSVTASHSENGEDQPIGFANGDVHIVRTLLSKHVVAATYNDAVRRGILPKAVAADESSAILASYDEALGKLLQGSNGEPK